MVQSKREGFSVKSSVLTQLHFATLPCILSYIVVMGLRMALTRIPFCYQRASYVTVLHPSPCPTWSSVQIRATHPPYSQVLYWSKPDGETWNVLHPHAASTEQAQSPFAYNTLNFPQVFSTCALLPPSAECENGCRSTDCLLAEMEELQQAADKQVARHLLLCLLLTVSLLVVSKPPPVSATVTRSQPDGPALLYLVHHKPSQIQMAGLDNFHVLSVLLEDLLQISLRTM